MDNEALQELIDNPASRQFWIVLWGYPEHSSDEDDQVFDQPTYDQGLARKPEAMRLGDIVFVHRIHISKIIFVGEVIDEPRLSSPREAEKDDWRRRWKWGVGLKNLTPTYGRHWRQRGQKTFPLKDQYNAANPDRRVSLGRLQHGLHTQITPSFAKFLLNEIASIR